jgi:hypothetical protein
MTNMSIPKTAVLLAVIGAGVLSAACDPIAVGSENRPQVMAVNYSRDSHHPTTGTHRAECSDIAGNGWQVDITAGQARTLHTGDPCPAGTHQPLARQQHPEIWDALTAPLPYRGGDPYSPCGSWEAATQRDANEMRAAWNTCMAGH